MNWKKMWRAISLALALCLLTLTFSLDASASQRRRRHNPQAGKRKAAKASGELMGGERRSVGRGNGCLVIARIERDHHSLREAVARDAGGRADNPLPVQGKEPYLLRRSSYLVPPI